MANKKAAGIEEAEATAPPVVQSTTEETPSPADETSMPNAINTETEQPPARTAKPDTPIAHSLSAGAGLHTPPDPAEFDIEGRPVAAEAAAEES